MCMYVYVYIGLPRLSSYTHIHTQTHTTRELAEGSSWAPRQTRALISLNSLQKKKTMFIGTLSERARRLKKGSDFWYVPGAAGAMDQVVELTLRSRNVGLGSGGRSGCPALRSQSRKVDTVRQQARKGAVPFRGQARQIRRNGRSPCEAMPRLRPVFYSSSSLASHGEFAGM